MEQERNFYTEKGVETLTRRLERLIRFFNQGKFQFRVYMLGFGILEIESKEQLLGRIKELSEIIGFKWDMEYRTIKEGDQEEIMERIIR